MTARIDRDALRVARGLSLDLVAYAGIWAAVVLAIVIVSTTVNELAGTVGSSRWDSTRNMVPFLVFGAGVLLMTAYLPLCVANGVTRRSFLRAVVPVTVGLALVAALLVILLFGLERLVFGIADWPHVLQGDPAHRLFDRPDDYGRILLQMVLQLPSYGITGLLLGAAFYRFGGLYGIPVGLLAWVVAVGAEMALGGGPFGGWANQALDRTPPPLAVGVLITLALWVLGTLATAALARNVQVENRHVVPWR